MRIARAGKRWKEIGKYLFWYTVLFGVTSCGVFLMFWVKGKSFCWTTDAVSQYVPKMYYFMKHVRQIVAGIISGNPTFPMYDFCIGMGDGIQFRTEPLYWLSLLYRGAHTEYAYGFLTLTRFYFAGLSMSAFLLYFQHGRWETLLASMMYIYSGFGLFGGLRHGHFIIPMIMLPLLCLAIEEIYRNGRWYWCTIFSAVGILCGYYFMYMNTLAMGIFFLIRFFMGEKKRTFAGFWKDVGMIAGSYLTGILIGNITLFNTFAELLTSARTSSTVSRPENIWYYGVDWALKFFRSFISTTTFPGEWMWLGFIPLAYLMIVLMWIRKGRKQQKTAFVLGILFGLVPLFGIIFSGFGNLTNRWSYMLSFVVAIIAASMFRELFTLTKKEMLLLAGSMIPYVILMFSDSKTGGQVWKASAVAGVVLIGSCLCVVILNLWKKKPKIVNYAAVSMLVIGSLWVSGLCRYSSYGASMINEFTARGKAISKATNTPLKAAEEIEDSSFYRTETTDNSSNYQGASMILGNYGVVQYSSALNKSLIDFYREMGLTSWSLVRLRGFDNRTMLDSLAAVKYYLIEKGQEDEVPYGYRWNKEVLNGDKEYEIYERENTLPLGYTYDQVISVEDLEKYRSEERQEVLLQAAVLDELGDNELYTKSLPKVSGRKVNVTGYTCENLEIEDQSILILEEGAKLSIEFEGSDQCETYLCFRNMKMNRASNVWFYVKSRETEFDYCYHGDWSKYSTSQDDYIFNLGYSDEGKTTCTITFDKKGKITFDELLIYCQPLEDAETYISDRKEDVLENVEISENRITGSISLDEQKLLAVSMPYQSGWTAYVDGKKTEILKTNLMYMGLMLEPGDHMIEFRYCMPGIRISVVMSVLGLSIFIGALMIRRKRKHASQHYHTVL